jgi:hypothetical protein
VGLCVVSDTLRLPAHATPLKKVNLRTHAECRCALSPDYSPWEMLCFDFCV